MKNTCRNKNANNVPTVTHIGAVSARKSKWQLTKLGETALTSATIACGRGVCCLHSKYLQPIYNLLRCAI